MFGDELDHNDEVVELVRDAVPSDAPEDILAFADCNNVAIPVLTDLATENVPTEFSDRAADIRHEHRRYLLDLLALDELFDTHGIEYAAIKSRMLHDIQPWDLNILVAPEDWESTTSMLQEQGWRRSRLLEHPLARTEPGKHLYKHEEQFPVHLHRHVSWNGVTYIPAETVLANRTRSNGVVYPSWKMDTLIHCAHSVFENYELTLAEAYQISQVFGDWEGMQTVAQQHGWNQGYELAVTTARQVMSALNAETELTIPVSYSKRDLFRAWGDHAKTKSPHQLLAHAGLHLLK